MNSSANVAYRFNGFRIDPVRRLLFGADGEPIPLKPKVFDTLLYLVERRGVLVDKQALLEAVWPHVVVEDNNLNKAISTLRQVFGETRDEHRFIVTEPGRGYRFVARVDAVPAATTERDTAPETLARVLDSQPDFATLAIRGGGRPAATSFTTSRSMER
jgi:DNA-binding winged helix-turn-helix (wHTH) protein